MEITHPLRRRRISQLWSNIGVTAVSQSAVIISGVVVYRAISTQRSTEAFAVYVLIKQAAQIFYAFTMVGMTQGLTRTIAVTEVRARSQRDVYLVAALLICGVPFLLLVVISALAPHALGSLVLGPTASNGLLAALLCTLGASMAFRLFYGFYRGQMLFLAASAVEFIGVAALPLVFVLVLPYSVSVLMILMAIGLAVPSLALLAPHIGRGLRSGRGKIVPVGRELIQYGWRRVPGDAAYIALFGLPPILAVHSASLKDVGHLNAGLLVFVMLSAALFPISLVLLPTLSRSWATDSKETRRLAGQLSFISLHVAVFITPQIILFVDVITSGWLGSEFVSAHSLLRIMVLPAGLFAGCLSLRSVLDAVSVRSYNTRASIVGLAVLVGTYAIMFLVSGDSNIRVIAWSFDAGIATVSILLFAYVHRMFSLGWSQYAIGEAVVLGALTTVLALLARRGIDDLSSSTVAKLAEVAVLECGLAALYAAGIWATVKRGRVTYLRMDSGGEAGRRG